MRVFHNPYHRDNAHPGCRGNQQPNEWLHQAPSSFSAKFFEHALSSVVLRLPILGAIIAAYDMGVVATTFNSVPFIGESGMDFWLLNAILFGLVVHVSGEAEIRRRPA